MATAVIRHSDVHGLLRGSRWVAGQPVSELAMAEISAKTQDAVSEVLDDVSAQEQAATSSTTFGKGQNAPTQLLLWFLALIKKILQQLYCSH